MIRDGSSPSQERPRGASLGLPGDGPGSLAAFSTRAGAFLIDSIAAALVAGLFTAPELPGNWSLLAFAVLTVGSLVAAGQTPGMRLLGLRLAGDAWYHGVLHRKSFIGDAVREIETDDIPRACRLMTVTALLALVLFAGIKALILL